jgi:UDP-GlcNAc:undecaprenyl-phosphate GlcNAc-1-phosphate transferase
MHWFKATRNHIHHRLLDLGFTHFQTVVIIYSVQALLATSSVLMRYQSDLAITVTYLAVVTGLFTALTVAEGNGWKASARTATTHFELPERLRRLVSNGTVRSVPLLIISVIVPLFMLLGALSVQVVPSDFGAVASVLTALALIQLVRGRAVGSLMMRALIYAAAAFSAYLFVMFPAMTGAFTVRFADAMIVALAAALGIFIRFLAERKFSTTPTDFLVVFGVVALVMFNRADIEENAITQFVTYAIVLFYGCEVITERMQSRWHVLNWAAVTSLAIAAIKGLWPGA